MLGFLYSLFFGPRWPMNQLNKNPNIALLETSYQLWLWRRGKVHMQSIGLLRLGVPLHRAGLFTGPSFDIDRRNCWCSPQMHKSKPSNPPRRQDEQGWDKGGARLRERIMKWSRQLPPWNICWNTFTARHGMFHYTSLETTIMEISTVIIVGPAIGLFL